MENGAVYFGRIKQGRRHDCNAAGDEAVLIFDDLRLVYRGQYQDDMK